MFVKKVSELPQFVLFEPVQKEGEDAVKNVIAEGNNANPDMDPGEDGKK